MCVDSQNFFKKKKKTIFFSVTCNASASSRRSSSVFIVTNLSTNRSSEAATTANPNRMNINVNATYSSLSFNVLFFCKATMSPNLRSKKRPNVKNIIRKKKKMQYMRGVAAACAFIPKIKEIIDKTKIQQTRSRHTESIAKYSYAQYSKI